MCILDADQTRPWRVLRRRPQRLLQILGGHDVAAGSNHAQLDAAYRSRRRHLVMHHVGAGVRVYLRSPLGQDPDRRLIGHGATGEEKRLLLAEHRRHVFFQPAHRRIAVQHIVPHFRFGHGATHGGSRTGDGVGAQVDR